MAAAGFWVDLQGFKFDENSTQTWIQAMPLGTYEHPSYGAIEITPERVTRFAEGVKTKVRGTDLDIDYDHKQYGGEAAGWVKDAEARTDGLWLLVDWTQKAYSLLKEKAYRYFSPEFDDEWTNPKTNVKHTDVIFGGGITNRPFLKDILPINMSEVFGNVPPKPNEGGKVVTPEQIAAAAEKLGLDPATATEDDIFNELSTLEVVDAVPETQPIAATEPDAATKKLMDENPAIKALFETSQAQTKQLEEMQTALRLSEVTNTVTKLTEHARSKKVTIPPADVQELTTTLLGLPKQLSDKMVEGWTRMIDAKVVQLGEIGSGRGTFQLIEGGNEGGKDATEELATGVKALMDADKGLSFGEATKRWADANPDEYRRYRAEVGRGTGTNE